jgi:hypothetical protein
MCRAKSSWVTTLKIGSRTGREIDPLLKVFADLKVGRWHPPPWLCVEFDVLKVGNEEGDEDGFFLA